MRVVQAIMLVVPLAGVALGGIVRAAPQGDAIQLQGTAGIWTIKSVRTTCVMAARPSGSLAQPPELTGTLRDDGGVGFYISGFASGDRISASKGQFAVAVDGRGYGDAAFTPGGGSGALAYGPSLRIDLGPEFRRALATGRLLTLTRSDGVAATPLRFELRDMPAALDALAACDKRVGRVAAPPPPPRAVAMTVPFAHPVTVGPWTIDPYRGCRITGGADFVYGSLRMRERGVVAILPERAGYRITVSGIPSTMLEPRTGLTLTIDNRSFPMERTLDSTALRRFEAVVDPAVATTTARSMVLAGADDRGKRREIAMVLIPDLAPALQSLPMCRPLRR